MRSDGRCTVHKLAELSLEGQRAQENGTRRRHKQLRKRELFEELGRAMKRDHFAQCKVAQRIDETESTSMRRKAMVQDMLGGVSSFDSQCTRARRILSQRHGQSYESTTPLLDLCASLERGRRRHVPCL